MHYVFVEEVVVIATEKKPENRLAAGNLFCHLMKENVLKYSELEEGLVYVLHMKSICYFIGGHFDFRIIII